MEFKETISEEAFYKRVYKKSNSQDSMTQAKVTVSNLRYYCRDVFDCYSNKIQETIELAKSKTLSVTRLVNEGILGGMIHHEKRCERDAHGRYAVLTAHKVTYFWKWVVVKLPKDGRTPTTQWTLCPNCSGNECNPARHPHIPVRSSCILSWDHWNLIV